MKENSNDNNNNERKPGHSMDMPIQQKENSENSKIARMISELPPKVIEKLLLANHEAELGGDQRSLLNPDKLIPLLLSPKNEAHHLSKDRRFVDLLEQVKTINDIYTPEDLADMILRLAGIQNQGGFLKEELRAQYPKVNKATLVSIGVLEMMVMLLDALNPRDSADYQTTIAKFSAHIDAYLNKRFVESVNSEPWVEEPIEIIGSNGLMSGE